MLQQQNRLPGNVRLKASTSFSTRTFILKAGENNLPVSRFGFVVRKTLDKRATVRNRIRRVFRSCIEELLPEIKKGYDMLFLLSAKTLEMEREALYNELHNFLKEKQFLT